MVNCFQLVFRSYVSKLKISVSILDDSLDSNKMKIKKINFIFEKQVQMLFFYNEQNQNLLVQIFVNSGTYVKFLCPIKYYHIFSKL